MLMRRLFIRATGVGALLAVTAAGAFAANILTNPGFESGDLTGWSVFGQTASANVVVLPGDNGPSAPGTNHAFMDNHAEALGLTLKQTTAPGSAAGGTINWSFDLKLGQAANGGVFFVQIFAEQEGVGIVGTSGLLGNYAPANWTTFSGSFVAPATTDFLTIQFMANTGAVIGSISSMQVDNVVLDPGTIVPTLSRSWGRIKSLYQ